MCDPISIGIALTAAGGLAQSLGQGQAERAQLRTQQAERARQAKLTAEQQGYFDDTLAKTTAAASTEGQDKATATRNDVLQAAIPGARPTADYMPGLASAPTVVQGAADRAATATRADSSNLARTIAALGGSGDALQTLNIEALRNRQRTGQAASFKAGSSNVLESELTAAAQKGGTLRGLGSLAQQIGGMAIGAGVGGGGFGGFGSTPALAAGSPVVDLASLGREWANIGPVPISGFFG